MGNFLKTPVEKLEEKLDTINDLILLSQLNVNTLTQEATADELQAKELARIGDPQHQGLHLCKSALRKRKRALGWQEKEQQLQSVVNSVKSAIMLHEYKEAMLGMKSVMDQVNKSLNPAQVAEDLKSLEKTMEDFKVAEGHLDSSLELEKAISDEDTISAKALWERIFEEEGLVMLPDPSDFKPLMEKKKVIVE